MEINLEGVQSQIGTAIIDYNSGNVVKVSVDIYIYLFTCFKTLVFSIELYITVHQRIK